jgi:hypothetical protein
MEFEDSVNTANAIKDFHVIPLSDQSHVGANGTVSALLMR